MCVTLVWMLTAVWQMTVEHQIAALTPYQPRRLETLQAIWVPARAVAHQMTVAMAQQSQPEKTPSSLTQTVHRHHPQGKPLHPVLRQLNQPASQADHLHHHHLTTQWQWANSTESKWDMPPLSQSMGKEINKPDKEVAQHECNQLPRELNEPQPGPGPGPSSGASCGARGKHRDRLRSSSHEEEWPSKRRSYTRTR